ncbi:MAG TPA: asparagine synthase-related protein [Polyangiales bacterium]|nr:asparagine synthase-related protein [Polyangiales bacterium]
MTTARRVRPAPGPSFAQHTAARRARIGGACGSAATAFVLGLQRCLGESARLLPRDALVVDADACTLDGRALSTRDDWWNVARTAPDSLARVEGAFVLAWTREDGSVSLARDAIGHRSLYYTLHGDTLVFASSLRALLDTGAAARRIHLRSVAAYLAYAYVPGRHTLVEDVYELLPGELVTYRGGALERRAHWELPGEPASFESEDVLRSRLRAELGRTVSALLPGDAPVAASLSGGIDSSLVVALAQRASPRPVRTFSITFGADYRDELPFSSLVAEHCGTEHSIVELTPETVLAHLDDTVACLDKPNGDPLTVPNALLFRTMAESAEVALNGEGGDPCFGGPKNAPMLLSSLYDEEAAERAYLRAHQKAYDELPELLASDVFATACATPLEDDLAPWFRDERWTGLVSRLMAINTRFKGGHHILPKVDALAAPFGVLPRSPLFAKSVVELAFAIPPELKLRGSEEKYLLKQAVAELLPRAILERPKSGMLVPVEGWFQGPLLPEARKRILDGLARTRLFQRTYLEKLLNGKLGGLRPRRGVKIWLLITLEAHLRALGLGG